MKDDKNALSKEMDETKLKVLQMRVENNSSIMDKLVSDLIKKYVEDLDSLVANIKTLLLDDESPITDVELDEAMLKLSTFLYFSGQGLEQLGIREDVAQSVRQELYNSVYEQTTTGKATIGDKQNAAEAATVTEYLVYSAYKRAAKTLKFKVEQGQELLNSIKKVVSRRMGEYQIMKVGNQ